MTKRKPVLPDGGFFHIYAKDRAEEVFGEAHPSDYGQPGWRVGLKPDPSGCWMLTMVFASKRDTEQAIRSLVAAGVTANNITDYTDPELYRIMTQDLKW